MYTVKEELKTTLIMYNIYFNPPFDKVEVRAQMPEATDSLQ